MYNNFTHAHARQLAGIDEGSEQWMKTIRHLLTRDSNALREAVIAALLFMDPTGGGPGTSDFTGTWTTHLGTVKKEGDAKSGLDLLFCDGYTSWKDKLDWFCVFYEFDSKGLVYLADVEVSCCAEELAASAAAINPNSKGRKHVSVPFNIWSSKPSARLLYKAENRFPCDGRKKEKTYRAKFCDLLKLPYKPIFEVDN